MDNECIFCKIINGQLPAEKVAETDTALAFLDIHPKAKIHILIIPKKHIVSIKDEGSENVAFELIKLAKKIAKDKFLIHCCSSKI